MAELSTEQLAVSIGRLDSKVNGLIERFEDRFKAQEMAIAKAEAAQENKNQTLNELRGVVTDQQGAFARSAVVNLQVDALTTRIGAIELDMRGFKERGGGVHTTVGYLFGVAGIVVAIMAIYFKHG